MFFIRTFSLLTTLIIALTACTPVATVTPPTAKADEVVSGKLVVYSGRSEALIQPVLNAFKSKYPDVELLLKAGSNSEIANALIEEQANSQADVFITTELFTVQSLASKGVFQPYVPVGTDRFPSGYMALDKTWTGLTLRARVIMYNTDLVSKDQLPTSIFGLTDPKWKGKIAAAGSTNGSLQAQIAAMRQMLGESATEEWVKKLIANDVTFFGGHTDVRKAVGAGEFALGLVNHYYYYLQKAEGSKVGVIYPDQGADQIGLITNATAAAIVNGAHNLPAARALLDYLVSAEGQKIFAEKNYEYPLLPGVELRSGVQSLQGLKLANVNLAIAAQEFDATFNLMERNNLP